MNERIKELAVQAGIFFGGHPMNPLSVYFSDLKRFAELVRQDERQALAQEQTKCPRCGEVNPAEIHTCSPQIAHSEQEPVAYMSIVKKDSAFDKFRFTQSDMYPTPVYTAPPKREWVGLHLDDIPETFVGDWSFLEGARWAEAKLKEKNGA